MLHESWIPAYAGMTTFYEAVIVHRYAVKFYRKADDALKKRVADAIDGIARNPHMDGHIKKRRICLFLKKMLPTLPRDHMVCVNSVSAKRTAASAIARGWPCWTVLSMADRPFILSLSLLSVKQPLTIIDNA